MLENLVDVSMEMQAIVEGKDFSVYRLGQTKNRLAEPTDDIILAVHSEELGYGFEKVCDTQHILAGLPVSLVYKSKQLGVLECAHYYEEKRRQQHTRQWLDYHARRSRRRYAATRTMSSGLSVFRVIENIGEVGRRMGPTLPAGSLGVPGGGGIGAPRFLSDTLARRRPT